MRKILVFILSLSFYVVNAQFEIGMNVGVALNNTNKSNETFYDFANYTSFYPEIKAGYFFNEHWGINLGVGFSSKGYKLVPSKELKETEDYCKFRYFSIPVYVTYRYCINSFYGGLSLGIQPDFYNAQNTPARYEQDFQQMNNTIGLLLGAEVGYFVNRDLKLHFTYRRNTDLNYADELEKQGKFRGNLFLIGISYMLNPIETVIVEYR